MEKFRFQIGKSIVALFIFALILIVGSKTGWFTNWQIDLNDFSYQLGYGILIGLIPSILIGFISFKEQFERQLKVLGLSKEVINAGISEYHDNWDKSILEEKLKKSDNVIFYMIYGSTVIKELSRTMQNRLREEDFSIKIYLLDKDNPFVESLGNLWAKDNEKYNSDGIRSKIDDVKKEIDTICKNLKKKNELNGNIEVYQLKYHPVFFSFYQFDNSVVFVPTKNVEEKYFQIPSFVCEKIIDGGIHNWCIKQINSIESLEEKALKKVV
jgi:hypothetical protein